VADLTNCLLDSGLKSRPELRRATDADFDLEEALDKLRRKAHRTNETKLRSAVANAHIADKVTRNVAVDANGKQNMSPLAAVRALLVRDLADRSGHMNVESLKKGYAAVLHAPLAKAAEKFKLTLTGGARNVETMRDAARVARGGQAKDAEANEIGIAFRKAMEDGHRMLKNLGVDVGEIPNYLPQRHVRDKLIAGGRSNQATAKDFKRNAELARDRWKSYVTERLDRTKMVDDNGDVLDAKQLDELLDYVWASITTDGRHKLKAPVDLQARVAPAQSPRFGMERVLHFKSADAAIEYADEYGVNDWWGNITNHIESMATTAGASRMFGPEAEYVYGQWREWAVREDSLFDQGALDNIWTNLIGFPAGTDTWVTHATNAARDFLSASYMGSAVVVSITDTVPMMLNASLNGMKIGRMLSTLMSYRDAGDREILSRTLGHIEYGISTLATAQRYEDTMGRGVTRRVSDAVYRVQGMTGLMNMLRHTWMAEFSTMLGDNLGKTFDELPAGVRGFLETYGLDKKWDAFRGGVKTVDFRGSKVVDIASMDDELLKSEILGAIYTERDMAVLHPDARVRALLNQGKNPGTLIGESLRSLGQFKTFPATIIMHAVWRYFASNRLDWATRGKYVIGLSVGMAGMGAVALQLKELLKGRDPRDMTTKDFALRSFAQGGAMPGLAELFLDDQTRHGNSDLETMLGPTGAALNTFKNVGTAMSKVMLSDDPRDAKKDLSKEIEQLSNIVPGSSLWFARLAIQRGIRDQLLELTGPEYGQRQREREKNRYNKFKQGEWWGYDSDPEAPDFSELFGD
jgi:hypothetical protein